jgi:hypothetical protein
MAQRIDCGFYRKNAWEIKTEQLAQKMPEGEPSRRFEWIATTSSMEGKDMPRKKAALKPAKKTATPQKADSAPIVEKPSRRTRKDPLVRKKY